MLGRCVTLDDGYADFCRMAVPILIRYEIPAMIFVVSDFVDRRVRSWNDAVRYLIHAANGEDLLLTVAGRRESSQLGGLRRPRFALGTASGRAVVFTYKGEVGADRRAGRRSGGKSAELPTPYTRQQAGKSCAGSTLGRSILATIPSRTRSCRTATRKSCGLNWKPLGRPMSMVSSEM